MCATNMRVVSADWLFSRWWRPSSWPRWWWGRPWRRSWHSPPSAHRPAPSGQAVRLTGRLSSISMAEHMVGRAGRHDRRGKRHCHRTPTVMGQGASPRARATVDARALELYPLRSCAPQPHVGEDGSSRGAVSQPDDEQSHPRSSLRADLDAGRPRHRWCRNHLHRGLPAPGVIAAEGVREGMALRLNFTAISCSSARMRVSGGSVSAPWR